ncbi:MAG: tetratricopeptide repeat protein [Cyanobacteria bacterium J06648_11]
MKISPIALSLFPSNTTDRKTNWKTRPLSLTCLVLCTSLSVALLSPPAKANRTRTNRIESITGGPAYLQRSTGRNFSRTSVGARISREDFLFVPAGTSVQLRCDNGTTPRWTSTEPDNVGSVCPGQSRRFRPGTGVAEQWGASDASQPYVITPRTGQILTATPTLSWNAVEGAQQYEITLQKRAGTRWVDIWTTTSEQATLDYPNDQPALDPGKEYTLQVSIIGQPDSAEPLAEKPIFSLVRENSRPGIEEAIADIDALETAPVNKTVMLVEEVYTQHQLIARGITELSALVESGQATAQVHRLLGDYAVRSGLSLLAEENFLEAIALAATTAELEEQILATFELGKAYSGMDKPTLAQLYLQQAEQLAQALGNDELVADILQALDEVQANKES